jgi:hypothetical protein
LAAGAWHLELPQYDEAHDLLVSQRSPLVRAEPSTHLPLEHLFEMH